MGLCSSKPEPISAPKRNTSQISAQRAPPSHHAGTQNKKTSRIQQPKPRRTRSKKTKTGGKRTDSTKSKKAKRSIKAAEKPSVGRTVSDTIDENRERLSPREAARLAAEKRFQESNEKSTKGELGKKLAQEKRKSMRTHMLEETERREAERNDTSLIYD